MAAYYPSLTSPKSIPHSPYSIGRKDASLQSSDLPENMVFANQVSTMSLHPQLLSGTSFSGDTCVEAHSVGSRDEMSLILQNGDPGSIQPIGRQLNIIPALSEGNAAVLDSQMFSHKFLNIRDEGLQYRELSLSLGTEMPSSCQMSSYQNHYTVPGPSPWMSSGVGNADEQSSHNGQEKMAKYLSFDFVGGSRDIARVGTMGNPQFSMDSTELNPASNWHDTSGIAGYFYRSKYLKAAQEILDEVVNVRGALKQPYKHQSFRSLGEDVTEETDLIPNSHSKGATAFSDPLESTTKTSELSAIERQELLNKMTKLSSMLEELDKRYRQYHQQIQLLVSSFEMVVGCGASKPYTRLALQTISVQFRRIRDAIKRHLQVTQQCLGEQGETENGGVALPRLRYIDQKLRQQRTLQQFGIVRQPWRPQKGLPETAVSILRAWLFEHFLNPYPKDSEKVMLAKQTGLTRSQVANWFINARVRLWKPMIEDMYKEEFSYTEADSEHSPEHVPAEPTENSTSGNKSQSFQKSTRYVVFGNDNLGQSNKSRPDDIPNSITSTNNTVGGNSVAAADSYDVSMLNSTAGNQQVSLALGLQQFEKEYRPIPSGTQIKDDDTITPPGDLSKVEYYCMEPLNQQERFSNPHLLSDFIM